MHTFGEGAQRGREEVTPRVSQFYGLSNAGNSRVAHFHLQAKSRGEKTGGGGLLDSKSDPSPPALPAGFRYVGISSVSLHLRSLFPVFRQNARC